MHCDAHGAAPSISAFAPACAAAALALLAAPGFAKECQLACLASKDTECAVRDPARPGLSIKGGSYKNFPECDAFSFDDVSKIELRYRHKLRWFSPPEGVKPQTPLQVVFAKYPPDACALPLPACIQKSMSGMVGSIGGHGIDGKESRPGGTGDPCALGLPCGVVLPPAEAWVFRLADPGLSGTMTIRLARGTPAPGRASQTSVPVAAGVARGDGAWFVPGAQYVYSFATPDRGSTDGEFSVAAPTARQTLATLMQRRIAQGLPEFLAWADTLAANNYDWDAWQLSLLAQEGR